MSFPLWKPHSAFQAPQDSSNSNHTQSNECQLSVVLLIAWGIKVTQYQFSRWRQKLVAEYLVVLSHCVVQFFEVGFHFSFQPELLIDEVNLFLPLLSPFYLRLLQLLYHQVLPLSLCRCHPWTALKTSKKCW